jgi:hypothetical protein
LHEAVRREFELKRGIPEEVAFAIMSKESSLRHCEGGVVKLNNSGSGLTDGGTGFCQITPVGMETLAAVTNNAIAQTDWAHHLEQCAAALDQKWIVANRGNCAVATAGSCVERELLEEWLWPIALFNGAPPLSLKSKYVADVAAFMADPIDPHVVPVTVSNPESCIDGFQFRVDANGHLSAYLTGDMFKKGCALHGAAQWRAPLSYTGIQLKLTSGWGTGALSGYHVNARAVDVGVATETVRQWGIPLLCPFDVGCEVRAGGSASGPYWIRFRRADGFAEFVGRGGYEVLHINGVNDGLSCRGALPDSSRTFTAAFGDVMGYTARPGEKGYGASDPGAGPHGHVAKCQESAWEQTSSCYGSAEPFALKFSGAVYSSDALRQSVLGSTFVTGLEMPDEGQGALPSNYSEDASTCCMAGCEALPGACPSGDGDYCGEGVALTAGTLYHCEGGVFSVKSVCTSGCHVAPSGQDDTCNVGTEPTITITSPLPGTALVRGATILLTYSSQGFDAVQPLSMRVVAIDNSNVELTPTIAAQAGLNDSIPVTIPASWPNQIRLCVSSNAKPVSTCVGPLQVVDAPTSCANGDGDYCGEAAGLTAGTLYHCEGGVFSVKSVCTSGCHVAPSGQDDTCNVGTEPTITITSPLPGTALVRGATILLTYSSQGFDAVQPLSMRVVAIDNSNVELTPTIAAQAGLNDSIPVTIPASWPNQIRLCVSSNAKPVSTCVGPLQVVDAPTSCANGDGDYCGEAAGLTAGTLYHCEGGVFSVKLVCTAGCHIAGTGQNDSCNPEPQCYPEICNGVDDDCDGVIDEQLTRACSSACGDGVETCVAGQWQGCTAPSQCTQPLRYRIKWSAPVTVVNAIAIKDYPWSTVCVADNATPKTEVECDAAEAPHQFYWESQASWTTDPNAKVWSCGWSTPAPPQACLPFGSVGVEDTVAGISVQYTLQLLSVPGSVDKQCRHVMN